MDGQPQGSSRVNALAIPIAIIISAGLIAAAIYLNGTRPAPVTANPEDEVALPDNAEVLPVTDADHIRGNPNAPIMLVEYSDYDCPFCRLFHDTMTRIMAEYGADGKVAWVYRQFPLESLHPNAPKIAEASECVAELGGNEAFWTFTDALNESRAITYDAGGNVKSIDPTDMSRLSEFAETAGVDKGQFELCYNSGKYTGTIASDFDEGLKSGARGTPYTVVIAGDQQGVINGALPYESVKESIETMLAQLEGRNEP